MTLHIENLSKLIAHMEALPPERINMADAFGMPTAAGGCGCVLHYASVLFPTACDKAYDPQRKIGWGLYTPDRYFEERHGVRRYPKPRVIATLKRLRDHFLATGQIVVDWGKEPGEPGWDGEVAETRAPWSVPQIAEARAVLPESLTRLVSQPVDLVRAGDRA